jgi:ABC-type bacteriocin/lantibiotic exporter with double-glycine peptidase domain
MIEQNKNFINIFPILTLYAYSGYRLIPALQQIFQCFTLLRFSKLTFNSIYKDINNKKNIKNFKQAKSKNSVFLFKKSILLKNISYSYPNTDKEALKSINLKIPAFSKVGIIGKSGSGKTTLVDLILGLLNPSKGTLSVDGKYITNSNKDSWQKAIGYVPQQIYIGDSSVKENIAFGLDYQKIDNNAVIKAAKISNIHNFIVDNLPEGYDTYLGDNGAKLSGGQRQRIALARALYRKPQILILDEATNSLDNFTEQEVIDSISNLNYKITIIFITHRLEILKNFDIIFYLNNGELKINKININ